MIDEVLAEGRPRYSDHDHRPPDSLSDMAQEVKLMYAQGDIDADTYHHLIDVARRGYLNWDELEQVRRKARSTGTGPQPAQPRKAEPRRARDTAIVSSLNRLYTHRSQLEQARTETEQVLQKLEADVTRLRAQAQTAEAQAQQALQDEVRAREYLEVKQDILDRVQVLEERIGGLRDSLHRIDDLHSELATREAELKALESGQELAELEANIREDLLDNRKEQRRPLS
jgi:prefoldin subunit 5